MKSIFLLIPFITAILPTISHSSNFTLKEQFFATDENTPMMEFGASIDSDGVHMIIGSCHDSGSSAVVNIYNSTNGQQTQQSISPSSDVSSFGCQVAISGNRALVTGSLIDDNAKIIFVFEKLNELWTQTSTIQTSDETAAYSFGSTLSLLGDRAVVGAMTAYTNTSNLYTGKAFVFDLVDDEWIETALEPNRVRKHGFFGTAISQTANRIAVGADGDYWQTTRRGKGFVTIFDLVEGEWLDTADFSTENVSMFDNFSKQVHLVGDMIIIGAPGRIGDYLSAAVYIFELEEGEWIEQVKLRKDDNQDIRTFGKDVAYEDGELFISASIYTEDNNNNLFSGIVYQYTKINGIWTETDAIQGPLTTDDYSFGDNIKYKNSHLIISNHLNNQSGEDSGTVFLYVKDPLFKNGFDAITD